MTQLGLLPLPLAPVLHCAQQPQITGFDLKNSAVSGKGHINGGLWGDAHQCLGAGGSHVPSGDCWGWGLWGWVGFLLGWGLLEGGAGEDAPPLMPSREMSEFEPRGHGWADGWFDGWTRWTGSTA